MKKIAFGWYGGKFSHLNWLLPLLPEAHHYVEPFGGSAAVLINRAPSPLETYNDLDGELVNFFMVLRERPEELIRRISLTPFSREEYEKALMSGPELGQIERARHFYIKARQTQMGLAQTASPGRWATCINTSRAGMAGAVSRWLGSISGLPEIADRLLRVQIEHRPALEVIKKYDGPNTLFYCDPPYLHASRGDSKAYEFEMDDNAHAELVDVLNKVQGKVALSSYDHPLMERLSGGGHWFKHMGPIKLAHTCKTARQEILWTNWGPSPPLTSTIRS